MYGPTRGEWRGEWNTGNVHDKPEEGESIVIEGEVPGVGERDRENPTLSDDAKRVDNHEDLSRDAGGIENVKEVVAQEEQPRRHLHSQRLDDVVQVARGFHQRPATHERPQLRRA